MVDKWEVSRRQATYTFTLRDGLKFHDGTAGDAGRLRRLDQALGASATRSARRCSPSRRDGRPSTRRRFTIKLKRPFGLSLDALAQASANVPFIMPERVAETDPFKQITRRSAPGRSSSCKDEWVPGNKVVYVKNTDYVPRKEPPSGRAGGKVVRSTASSGSTSPTRPRLPPRSMPARSTTGSMCRPTSRRCWPRTRTSRSRTSIRSARWG